MTPTRLLMEFDLAGAEWVVVAYASGDGRMIDVVETGKDPHATTATLITGAPLELILRESKLVGHTTDAVEIEEIRREQIPEVFNTQLVDFLPRSMSMRQCGKKTNHGCNYIMGPVQFADFSELDGNEAKRVIDTYTKKAYPGLPLWWDGIENQLKCNRTVMNCFHRKRRFLAPWSMDVVKAAVAFIPQSTVTDVVTWGMRKIYADTDLMERVDLLANVHDSLLQQMHITNWKQAALDCLAIRDYMSRPCVYNGREFVIGIDMKLGFSWGHMSEVRLTNDVHKLASDLKGAWEKFRAVQETTS